MRRVGKTDEGLARVLAAIVVCVVLILLGAGLYEFMNDSDQGSVTPHEKADVTSELSLSTTSTVGVDLSTTPFPPHTTSAVPMTTLSKPAQINWHLGGGGVWEAEGTPPPCPAQPLLDSPVDLSLVTSILYPGQVRGNAFKPHGGFRFDQQPNNDITVTVPMDAKLSRGTRGRFEGQDEIQYGFEFVAPCGIWYSFGHLRSLSPKFQAFADALPVVTERTQQQLYDIASSPDVKTGEVIATQVGITSTKNVFVELAVLDLRQKNGLTIRPEWAQFSDEFDPYGVCWLDLLPADDQAVAKALPGGDSVSGKESDYCK